MSTPFGLAPTRLRLFAPRPPRIDAADGTAQMACDVAAHGGPPRSVRARRRAAVPIRSAPLRPWARLKRPRRTSTVRRPRLSRARLDAARRHASPTGGPPPSSAIGKMGRRGSDRTSTTRIPGAQGGGAAPEEGPHGGAAPPPWACRRGPISSSRADRPQRVSRAARGRANPRPAERSFPHQTGSHRIPAGPYGATGSSASTCPSPDVEAPCSLHIIASAEKKSSRQDRPRNCQPSDVMHPSSPRFPKKNPHAPPSARLPGLRGTPATMPTAD
jgi:hypothetical protein